MKRNNIDSTDDRHLDRSIPGTSASSSNNWDDATISRINRRCNLSDDPTKIPDHIRNFLTSDEEIDVVSSPTISGNNRRDNFSDDPTTIPRHTENSLSSDEEIDVVSNSTGFTPYKYTQSRSLHVQNLNHFDHETRIALFQYYGVIREYKMYSDFVMIRYQTLAMAEVAKTLIVEEFKKKGCNITITYGKVVPTARIWIGGLHPNIIENEVYTELPFSQYIVNITWARNLKDSEVFVLYQYEHFAKKSFDFIYQGACELVPSPESPIQVGYTDICSYPVQHRQCYMIEDISDKCLTQIPSKLIMHSINAYVTLHFIAGNCSIAERLLFILKQFLLPITNITSDKNLNIDNMLNCPNSIFLGTFNPNQRERPNAIIKQLTGYNNVGCSSATVDNDTFYSVILPPSYLSTYIMKYYFADFLFNDIRNQCYVVVIVLENPPPSIINS